MKGKLSVKNAIDFSFNFNTKVARHSNLECV